MTKKFLLIFLGIFILGSVLRFYRLGDVPLGFHRDEVFLGYNAYSILKTGKDVSGSFLPLHLQSFIYSPSGYSYLSIPFIKLFGLTVFSVRFASAFFGVLTILLTFFQQENFFRTKNLRFGLPYAVLSCWRFRPGILIFPEPQQRIQSLFFL